MANRVLERLLGRWRELAATDGVSDAELLRRFTAGDGAAFELLVWRHGAVVLGVCRRAVRDEQLAEDAFQAVFLVLARKAKTVRGGNVAGWLFRVARRVSARANRKRPAEVALRDHAATPSPCAVERRELAAVLDAEVARLPDRLRRAVVLCYLGGRTTEEAARELGCPRGTVLSRLAAARTRLADRLTRRGVTLPAVLAVPGVGVGNRLVTAAATAATAFRLGTHPVSTATILAAGVCAAMTRSTVLSVLGGVVLATGVGFVTAQGTKPAATADVVATADPAQPKAAEPKADKPADRAEKLVKQSTELARRVEQLQARIEREAPAAADTLDIVVLLSALSGLDRSVLDAELRVKVARRRVESAEKSLEEVRKRPPPDNTVTALINADPEVIELKTKLDKKNEFVKSFGEGTPGRAAAEREQTALADKLKARREAVTKDAEAKARTQEERLYHSYVEREKDGFDTATELLADIHEQRGKLIERIASQKQTEGKRQHLQDELRVLRQIQLELFRQQTLAELGIEGLPPAPVVRTETDPRVEAQLRELQREVEVLRGELEKLKKK